uniref:Uncharacterized protein n=1 Tax=Daphnia galeata TaxID=27404 RepID=A0A8J2RWF4_9CRUS|nr:unnamed protein product [Daphnia galeata]
MLSAGFSPSKTLNGPKRQKTEYFSDQKWITEQELEKTMAAMFFYAVVGRGKIPSYTYSASIDGFSNLSREAQVMAERNILHLPEPKSKERFTITQSKYILRYYQKIKSWTSLFHSPQRLGCVLTLLQSSFIPNL